MLIFRNQKISSLWLHENFLIDYWMYYTACPFSLAEHWQICLREGENPMPYLHRGLVQAMSEGAGKGIFWPWFDHPNSPCSDSVDFLSFNFTASFAVSSPPVLWPFLATLPIVGISITTCQMLQTGGCVLTIPYFQSLEVFTLILVKELHAFLRLMLLGAFNASVISVKISWIKWFLCSKEQQIFWKQKDSESEAWAHSQMTVPEPELVPVFTQISD